MERNLNGLLGENMEATDGQIGKVEDFYFEDNTWIIRYLIVNTGAWVVGRKVLISPDALPKHSWASGMFKANITKEQVSDSPDTDSNGDRHLRSCREVNGYHVQASDGAIGHVTDFIVDDQTWQILYLVVDTHNLIGGKKVLVGVRHIKEVQWESSKVLADITIDNIKNGIAAEVSGGTGGGIS